YADLKKPEDALKQVNEYLGLMPSGMEAYELKIKLLKRLDREKDILPAVQEAAQRDRHNQGLQLLLARELRNARQPAAAEELYQRLAKDRPSPEVFKGLLDLYKED